RAGFPAPEWWKLRIHVASDQLGARGAAGFVRQRFRTPARPKSSSAFARDGGLSFTAFLASAFTARLSASDDSDYQLRPSRGQNHDPREHRDRLFANGDSRSDRRYG